MHNAAFRRFAAGLVASGTLVFASGGASARPGTHAPAFSTWDARASSVVPGFMLGFPSGGGHLTYVSYNANFSSTSGNLSSQFGLHYVNLGTPDGPTLYGASGTATALFSVPLADRYENGVPAVALGFYLGAAPTALVSGQLNYMSLPATFGFGIPLAPAPVFTITPWAEVSPSFDIDSKYTPQNIDIASYVSRAQAGTLTQADASDLVASAVTLDKSFHVGYRAGLQAALNLGDDVSVQANGMYWRLGGVDGSVSVVGVGAVLIYRWDDIVPAVLPAETRLLRESCESVSERFQLCPQYKEMQSRQRPMSQEPPRGAPVAPPVSAPPTPALPPASPPMAPAAPTSAAPAYAPPPAGPAPVGPPYGTAPTMGVMPPAGAAPEPPIAPSP